MIVGETTSCGVPGVQRRNFRSTSDFLYDRLVSKCVWYGLHGCHKVLGYDMIMLEHAYTLTHIRDLILARLALSLSTNLSNLLTLSLSIASPATFVFRLALSGPSGIYAVGLPREGLLGNTTVVVGPLLSLRANSPSS